MKSTVETWGEKKAEEYLLEIEAKLEDLADNPSLGKKRPEIFPGYYSFPVRKHVVFYIHKNNCIDIIGVLHSKMDINKNLL